MENSIWILLIPFAGTALGAACVYFLRSGMSARTENSLSGFAAGVMVAASIWSLLIPAMDQASGMGKFAFVAAVVGVWAGMLFLFLLAEEQAQQKHKTCPRHYSS